MLSSKLKVFYKLMINILRRFHIYNRLIFSFLIIIIFNLIFTSFFSIYISSRQIDKNIIASTGQVINGIIETINTDLEVYEDLAFKVNSNIQIRELLRNSQSIVSEWESLGISSELFSKSVEEIDPQYIEQYQEYKNIKKDIGSILNQMSITYDIISNLEILTQYDEFVQMNTIGEKTGAHLRDAKVYWEGDKIQDTIKASGSVKWFDTSKETGDFLYRDSDFLGIDNYITIMKSMPALASKSPLGIIIITIPISNFELSITLNNMYDSKEVVFLAGREGIISVLNGRYLIHGEMPKKYITDEMIVHKKGTMTKEIKNADVLFVYNSLGKMNVEVIYMVEKREIYSCIYLIRNVLLAITLLCVLITLLMSWLVTNSISIPLNKLKKTMEKVGENGIELAYEDDRSDEIGVLGAKFNMMMERIRRMVAKVAEVEINRKNEEIKRKDTELAALQMQINPHFMYNTIDIIRWNAIFEENGEGKVSKMLEAFSEFLRFNMKTANRLVYIGEEVEHIRSYINVLSFMNEINISIDVTMEQEELMYCKIPKLSFQPIVENTFKHSRGLENIDIKIYAYVKENDLFVEISDNGVGISPEKVTAINAELITGNNSDKNIGLKNISERIKLHFGDDYGLLVESKIREYTKIILHVPACKD